MRELEKPGRDPRDSFVPFSFRADIHELKDLQPGMVCPGIVTNVTNFGAFVDIGVHQDGLVHISQLADKFVKDPQEVVSAGDRVTVRVLEVKLDKKQIALTMKSERGDRTPDRPRRRPARAPTTAARALHHGPPPSRPTSPSTTRSPPRWPTRRRPGADGAHRRNRLPMRRPSTERTNRNENSRKNIAHMPSAAAT